MLKLANEKPPNYRRNMAKCINQGFEIYPFFYFVYFEFAFKFVNQFVVNYRH